MARERETAAIRRAFDELVRGGGGAVFVRGETGVGKTRLLDELLATWPGVRVRGWALPGAGPFTPLREALEDAHRVLGSGRWTEALDAVDPARADRTSDQQVQQARVTSGLLALGTAGPVVCVLEDLHQGGAAALETVGVVAGSAAGSGLLLLATYDDRGLARDHPLRRVRTALRRAGLLDEVRVPPLSPEQTTALVTAVAGPVAPDVTAAVHRASGGLTFFVEEIAHALARAHGDASLGEVGELPLPETVADVVLEATRSLREASADAVDTASVLGDSVDLEVLAQLIDPGEVDLLLESGLLEDAGATTARFRHPLDRAALYRSLSWSRRRQLHAAVAEELTRQGRPPELVAEHWVAAGRPTAARPLLLAAAQRSCAVHAYRDAASLAGRALALWPVDHAPSDRVTVVEALADCAERSGEPLAAAATWEQAIEDRRRLGDAVGAARARRRLANAAELAGDLDRAASARAAAADGFTAAGDPAAAVTERLALAEQVMSRGRVRESLRHLETARQEADRSGQPELHARVLTLEGAARSALGQHQEGLRLARAGLDLALDVGDPQVVGANYYELATALLHATEYTGAADTYQLAAAYCREHGVTEHEHACLACMSVAVRCQGEWDRALEISRDVLEDPRSSELVRMIALEESALITTLRGGHRRARGTLRRTLAFGREFGIFGVEIGSAWGLAVAAVATDPHATGDAVSDLLDRCEPIDEWHFALPALRWAAAYAGGVGERVLLARCQQVLSRAATHNSAPKVLSVLAQVSGELALLDGSSLAPEQLARSVELLGPGSSRYEHALATYRWGVALGRDGRRDDAVARLVEAYRTARRLGARPLARDCVRELDALGESVDQRLGRRAAQIVADAPLTRRESQVLRMVAEGRTNRAIADDLVLSVRTVDMHVRNILQKLDCPTRTAAGRRAVELGLVDASTATA